MYIHVLERYSQSPALNPIENLWTIFILKNKEQNFSFKNCKVGTDTPQGLGTVITTNACHTIQIFTCKTKIATTNSFPK